MAAAGVMSAEDSESEELLGDTGCEKTVAIPLEEAASESVQPFGRKRFAREMLLEGNEAQGVTPAMTVGGRRIKERVRLDRHKEKNSRKHKRQDCKGGKVGEKNCNECGKWKKLAEFPPNNCVCKFPCLLVKNNIYTACKRAGMLEWFHEQRSHAAKWKKVKCWYVRNCPPQKKLDGTGAMGGFKILEFQAFVRTEHQLLKDGVYEMMHLLAFQHWAAKPKNRPSRGLDGTTAQKEWESKFDLPDAFIDEDPDVDEAYKRRVGIRVKTVVTDRDMYAKGQGYNVSDGGKKKFTQGDVDTAYLRLHNNLDNAVLASNQMTGSDMHKMLVENSSHTVGSSSFDGAVASLGGLKVLQGLLHQAPEEEEDSGMSSASGDEGVLPQENTPGGKKKAVASKALWLNRDLSVGAAMREQKTWQQTSCATLKQIHKEGHHLLRAINKSVLSDLMLPETSTLDNRLRAAGLVLGLNDETKAFDEQPQQIVALAG